MDTDEKNEEAKSRILAAGVKVIDLLHEIFPGNEEHLAASTIIHLHHVMESLVETGAISITSLREL